MWQLYQFPLCPFSRKLRLLMSEKGIGYELWRENPWEGRDEFLAMNPAGRTPVAYEPERGVTLADSRAICEYFEETVERNPMINGTAANRAEIRRLVALFDENFFGDVTAPLLHERMKKRLIMRQSPDSRILREAMKLAHEHLYYIDYLIDNRPWLAGATMSLADLGIDPGSVGMAGATTKVTDSRKPEARGATVVVREEPEAAAKRIVDLLAERRLI